MIVINVILTYFRIKVNTIFSFDKNGKINIIELWNIKN